MVRTSVLKVATIVLMSSLDPAHIREAWSQGQCGSNTLSPNDEARLVFSSGFEGVGLGIPYGPTWMDVIYWQEITGQDTITGQNWPGETWGGEMKIQIVDPPAAVLNSLDTIVNYIDRQTQVLHLSVIKKTSDITQTPLLLEPTEEPPDFYISQWVKIPANTARLLGANGWASIGPEWKTEGDFRSMNELLSDGNNLTWSMKWDNNANGGLPFELFWRVLNNSVPVPAGQWMHIEFFTHRADTNGCTWLAVNGQTLFDQFGDNVGIKNAPINRIFIASPYSNAPLGMFVDDIVVYEGLPSAARRAVLSGGSLPAVGVTGEASSR